MNDPGTVLVIGYGNRLRGDDAVGPLAADAAAGWWLPGVEAVAVPQLTPELAAPLARARCAVFVDAATDADEVSCRAVTPSATASAMGHALDPGGLLGLALQAFGRAPGAWLLTLPTSAFEMGAGLTRAARTGLDEALDRIRRWLEAAADDRLDGFP